MLLIADEVQTGFARTGKLFAMEHHGVAADLTTMAKGLGGGLPISAVTGRAEVMDSPAPGGLGGTYAGNPLAVAAAHAVLDVIRDEDLCARATRLGQRLKQRLAGIAETVPEIAEIRGPGFMNAVEFNVAGSDRPNPDFANRVRQEALDRGLILLTCGVHGNVIRFLAPLTIPEPVFDEAMGILDQAMHAARG
jgi:4-aminobutyrate aminotransferase